MKIKGLSKILYAGLGALLAAQFAFATPNLYASSSQNTQNPACETSSKQLVAKRAGKAKSSSYEQEADYLFKQLSQKNSIFAKELEKLPEFQDGVSASEVKALEGIVDLVEDVNFPKDFAQNKKKVNLLKQLSHRILITWGYKAKEKKDFRGYFPIGNQGSRRGTVYILDAQPHNFESGDEITSKNIYPCQFVNWDSTAGAGDVDGILTIIDAKKNTDLTLQLGTEFIEFKIQDLYSGDLVFKDGQIKIGLIKNIQGNNSKAKILEEMILAGGKKKEYSSFLQALFWGYLDGKFDEQNNPLKDYKGHMAFIEETWGDMKGPRWEDFHEVTLRLNTPLLIDYYEKGNFRYKFYCGPKQSNKGIFKSKRGNCVDISEFTVYCLRKAGYKAGTITVRSGDGVGHTIAYYKEDGKLFIIDNANPQKGILGPFKSLEDSGYKRRT